MTTNNNTLCQATLESKGNSELLFDNCATNHVTASPSNSTQQFECNGGVNLVIGNGGLSIQNRDSTTLKFSYTNINLKSILHIHEITKSFLSISKITYDNNVIV